MYEVAFRLKGFKNKFRLDFAFSNRFQNSTGSLVGFICNSMAAPSSDHWKSFPERRTFLPLISTYVAPKSFTRAMGGMMLGIGPNFGSGILCWKINASGSAPKVWFSSVS